MIEINLLPESMRKAEATPLPRFIALCVGVLIVGALIVANLQFTLKIIPEAEKDLARKEQEKIDKEEEATELDRLEQEIAKINEHVGAIKDLYKKRRIWAKILYDVKRIVTHDPSLDETNPQARYLWLDELKYQASSRSGDQLEIMGYATDNNDETNSTLLLHRFFEEMLRYKSKRAPVEEERERLKKVIEDLHGDIAEQQKAWDRLRKENPGLEPKSPEIVKLEEDVKGLEEELEKLNNASAGRVSVTPFKDFFEPGGIQLTSSTWTKTPSPSDELKGAEDLPENVHKFRIIGALKSPEPEDDMPTRRR